MTPLYKAFILFMVGYLIGSIPFSWLWTRILSGKDVRYEGSGNVGASNAYRLGGWQSGLYAFLGDFFKVFHIIFWMDAHHYVWYCTGCVLGHLYSFLLKFKGGKGVSVFLGCMSIIFWPIGLLLPLLWIVISKISKKAFLGSFVVIFCSVIYAFFVKSAYAYWLFFISILIMIKHHDNIKRILRKQEHSL